MPNSGLLLASIFTSLGARVRFALGDDNDPTIAAHAYADDAAVLSGDGDFLRYFGRRAGGEISFLRRIFSGFSAGDERNRGLLALFPRIAPDNRSHPGWSLATQRGDKGGATRVPEPPPITSSVPQLVTRRDSAGAPLVLIASISAYPFAFLTAPAHDALRLHRPLRLATYGLLGEARVVETTLAWAPLPAGCAAAGWRTNALRSPRDGVWLPTESAATAADPWEDAAGAATAAEGDAVGSGEANRVAECAGLLRRLRGCRLADVQPALEALYDAVFPTGSVALATARAGTGAVVRPTALQARNERLCRFMAVLRFAVHAVAHADATAGERLAAQAHALLARFAARRLPGPRPPVGALHGRS